LSASGGAVIHPDREKAILVLDDGQPTDQAVKKIVSGPFKAQAGLILHAGTIERTSKVLGRELGWSQCMPLAELRHNFDDSCYLAVCDLLSGTRTPAWFWDIWSGKATIRHLNDLAMRIELQLLSPLSRNEFLDGVDEFAGFEEFAALLPEKLQDTVPRFADDPIPPDELRNALRIIREQSNILQSI